MFKIIHDRMASTWNQIEMGDQPRAENSNENSFFKVLGVPEVSASMEVWLSWAGGVPDHERQEIIKIKIGLVWF